MPSEAVAGWGLLGGIAIAYGGLMTRFAGTVYGRLGARDRTAERIAFVEERPIRWRLHNGLFAAGAVTAGTSLLWLGDDALTWTAAILATAGGLASGVFAVWRTSVPPAAWWGQPQPTATAFYWVYTALTVAAMSLLGVWFLDVAAWVGWWLVTWNALLVAIIAWKRDMPPFAHYVPLIAAGATLIA